MFLKWFTQFFFFIRVCCVVVVVVVATKKKKGKKKVPKIEEEEAPAVAAGRSHIDSREDTDFVRARSQLLGFYFFII